MSYSIVVPTLNPGSLWSEWIAAIDMQSISPLKVCVADSESEDDSVEKSTNAGFSVTRIKKTEFNHGGTRQKLIESIGGAEYVVLMTQDAVLSGPDAIKNILAPFQDENISAVCGRQLPRPKAGYIEAHSRIYNYPDQSSCRKFEDRKTIGLKAAFLSNSFSAYRVSSLLHVGGFPDDVIFGEDMYVGAKILKSGGFIAYADDATVYHSHHYTLFQEFKRYFDMGAFHARESWIRKEFGTAEGEGIKFVASEMKYLLKYVVWQVPSVILRILLRYVGFRLGLLERWLPAKLKARLSMNPNYFR